MPYTDPERKKEYDRRYGMAHRQEVSARRKAWYHAHPERGRELARNWAKKNWWKNHLRMLIGQQIYRANKEDT